MLTFHILTFTNLGRTKVFSILSFLTSFSMSWVCRKASFFNPIMLAFSTAPSSLTSPEPLVYKWREKPTSKPRKKGDVKKAVSMGNNWDRRERNIVVKLFYIIWNKRLINLCSCPKYSTLFEIAQCWRKKMNCHTKHCNCIIRSAD